MSKMNFLKGMGAGLVVGACIGMAVMPNKKGKSRLGKAVKTMGEVIEGISDSMGL